jgi:hypothetical protein
MAKRPKGRGREGSEREKTTPRGLWVERVDGENEHEKQAKEVRAAHVRKRLLRMHGVSSRGC